MTVIFDSSALIPTIKYAVEEKCLCEYLAECIEIHIPPAVQRETIVNPEKFSGAAMLQALISQNKIFVDAVAPIAETEEILTGYKLGRGEQEAILLYLQDQQKFDAVILDDYVATIVCRRLEIGSMLLLDLIVRLERERLMPHDLAVAMITKVASRYIRGFVKHSLQMIGEEKISVEPPPLYIKETLERYIAGNLIVDHLTPKDAEWRQRFARYYREYAVGLISLGGMAQPLRVASSEIDSVLEAIPLPLSTGLVELEELWEARRASANWLKRSQLLDRSLQEN
jgi:predicted nucleic acid-binding protein